ncbi:hypothetical protein BKA80DRAFT_285109 [Phyllosticta citrichinensis]
MRWICFSWDQVPALALPSHPRPAAYTFALYQRQTLRRRPLHGPGPQQRDHAGPPACPADDSDLRSAPWRTPTRRTSSPPRPECVRGRGRERAGGTSERGQCSKGAPKVLQRSQPRRIHSQDRG